jgi:hypothetical protein
MIGLVLLIVALICFLLASANIPARVNLVALGLAFWVLSLLIGGLGTGGHLGIR